jgi:hypothetical protein
MACLLFLTAGISFGQGLPSVTISDLTTTEKDPPITWLPEVEITLSAPSTQQVSVRVTTQNGTATDTDDYAGGSQVITFTPGQTSVHLGIGIRSDTTPEPTEHFFVNLSEPVNCTIARTQATVTIVDDDSLFLLNQDNGRGAALDSVLFKAETFGIINDRNFSADQRTRIMVFATGVKLAQGENASAVTATAEDSVGGVRPLAVEFVGGVPNFDWLTQVVLKLSDQLPTGDQKIRISLHGQTSNFVLVNVKPQ